MSLLDEYPPWRSRTVAGAATVSWGGGSAGEVAAGGAIGRNPHCRALVFAASCEAMVGTTKPMIVGGGSRESDGVVRDGGTVTGGEASRVGSILFMLRKPTE